MSLRVRLIGATLLLTALGFATAGFATYRLVESFLLDRLDTELAGERFEAFKAFRGPYGPDHGPATSRPDGPGGDSENGREYVPVGPNTYVQVRSTDGTVIESLDFSFQGMERATPNLPEVISLPEGETESWFTTRGVDGGPDFRVYVGPGASVDELVLIALPLSDVEATLDRLLLIEVGVSAAVLAIIGGLAFVSVRLGLRPLDRVVETADAIAAGDMARRVDVPSAKTEVGRLGSAFNSMLGAIQDAFTRQRHSEQKLREFVADASHELRTPLTSLKGYAEMLERPDIAQKDREMAARRIEEASNRMARLVDDMLLLARMDEEPALRLQRVDLLEVAAGAVADARAVEPERPVVLTEGEPVFVEGDRDHLGRAVANLLANVRMHTPPGTPARVSAGVHSGMAFVQVSDDGPGIPAAAQERLFERFFRLDKSRSRASGGAGLGLSIVASIAEAHGGSVTLESEPGKGATFRISLPLAEGEAPGAAAGGR